MVKWQKFFEVPCDSTISHILKVRVSCLADIPVKQLTDSDIDGKMVCLQLDRGTELALMCTI